MPNDKSKEPAQSNRATENLKQLQERTAVELEALLSQADDGDAIDAIETRAFQRKRSCHPAVAHFDGETQLDCTIVDMSQDGLRLQFGQIDFVPETVIFECNNLGGFIVGELRWHSGQEAGFQLDRAATRSLRLAASDKSAA